MFTSPAVEIIKHSALKARRIPSRSWCKLIKLHHQIFGGYAYIQIQSRVGAATKEVERTQIVPLERRGSVAGLQRRARWVEIQKIGQNLL